MIPLWKIKKEVLKLIMESSKSSYPNEFGAFLRAKHKIIYEIILLPGTISGGRSVLYNLLMKPIDFTIVGSVHSHPSGVPLPSQADLDMFSRTGDVHIIVAYPFTLSSWKAYNRMGEEIEVKII
ncbi:putative metal-dependent protease of the PAD1/JAB1 superfamily [Aciduliprofundum sp. MAR08-339]|uniref:Mov34/MPN/PAD-1 family protein n=1 Tax=Aciduliprofundum sp. (strain MAR08-339) TaxID=673860 RepID=UPI0002A480D8|nr:putative metal-dependent protease of the PAD1/JAB1 superfamily [Aciduliprofundum sp. MAR08-339]